MPACEGILPIEYYGRMGSNAKIFLAGTRYGKCTISQWKIRPLGRSEERKMKLFY